MRKRNNNKAGTTILEVLMAVTVLSVVISGLCGLVLHGRELSSVARSRYKATVLARNRIEKARNTDFELIYGLAEKDVVVNEFGEVDSGGYFRRTTTVTDVSSILLEILVRVDVKNRRTLDFTVQGEELQTYIAHYKEP
ncbi:hypothetical protein ACFLQY_01600 [Verrucomicrobiota bacterium]